MTAASLKPTNRKIVLTAIGTSIVVIALGSLPIPYLQGLARVTAAIAASPWSLLTALTLGPALLGSLIGSVVTAREGHSRWLQALQFVAFCAGLWLAGKIGPHLWTETIA